jgi:hypothetical protein
MRLCTSLLFSLLVLPGWHGAAMAAEIYRWVDADGILHYSDAAPREDVAVTTIELDTPRPPDYDPLSDPWSIMNQARRISEARSALVEARIGRERSAQAPTAAPPEQAPAYWQTPDYRDWWYYPAPLPRPDGHPGTARRQYDAMQQLDLTGPRPQSINSGVHQQRVERSTALPLTPVREPRQPGTHRN